MAVTCPASGTQTAVINTEHVLSDIAIAGVYSYHVNLSNMVSGDTTELRIKQVVLTGDVTAVAYKQVFNNAQDEDNTIAISVPIANDLIDATSLRFTLKQTAGTGRSYKWKILKY